MKHYIPYARSDISRTSSHEMDEYLGVDAFLALVRTQPPDVEFGLLVEFLVEFSGNVWDAYCRMQEMLVDQAARSYKAHYEALRKIKRRIFELYGEVE